MILDKKLKKELENKKPQIPTNGKMEKQVDKTNEKRRRIRCPYDRHRDLIRRGGARHYLCQQLRANCRAWEFTGHSSLLREAGPSRM
jgi:hypothetical protein